MAGIKVVLVLCVAVASFVKNTEACNGYEMKMNYVKNCIPNSNVVIQNVNAVLDNNCNVIPTGCANILKTFKVAKAHYTIKKSPMPAMDGEIDLCELIEDDNVSEINGMLAIFGVKNKCPIKAGKACSNGQKINLNKYKNQMGILVGTSTVKLDITHDGGMKSCVEMSMTFKRK